MDICYVYKPSTKFPVRGLQSIQLEYRSRTSRTIDRQMAYQAAITSF